MKTLEQIDAEIAALQQERDELANKEPKPFTKGWRYYLPGAYGLRWDGCRDDKTNRAAGLCFATQEDADTWHAVATRIDELNDKQGWKADWEDTTQQKWFLAINSRTGRIEEDQCLDALQAGVQHMSRITLYAIRAEFTDDQLRVYVRGGVR